MVYIDIFMCVLFSYFRKRQSSAEPQMVEQKTVKLASEKSAKPQVANNGWGEVFKNKENFVEMHIC